MREGDNLFCASIMAIDAKTGAYKWHFQEVHHDIWDYDAASPVVLFDTAIDGQPRKALAQAGRTGWVYILDRTNGKPLVGIEEKPVPQEPRQKTAKTQPIPGGRRHRAAMRRAGGRLRQGRLHLPAVLGHARADPALRIGGTNWSPMPYSPDTGFLYVTAPSGRVCSRGTATGLEERPALCRRHPGGTDRFGDERHVHRDQRHHQQDRLAAEAAVSHGRQRWWPVTAGGLLLRGSPDGNFVALNAKTGEVLWQFQTGFGADAPPMIYEVDGQQYVTIVAGGNSVHGSAFGDAVWTFALNGTVQPLWPPPAPATVAGPTGPIAEGVDRVGSATTTSNTPTGRRACG